MSIQGNNGSTDIGNLEKHVDGSVSNRSNGCNRHAADGLPMSLAGYQAQTVLFAERPSRLAVQQLEIDVNSLHPVSVNVWRNHAFEPIVALAHPYLAYGRYLADFRLSNYDDALIFNGHQSADIELLWLDSSRYLKNSPFDDWLEWIVARIKALRAASTAPIVVGTWLNDAAQRTEMQALIDTIPAVYFADLDAVCKEAGVNLTDSRSALMAGTPVSNAAQPLLARELCCHWIPAAILPPIKAVALDLDNTLHAGVLGEDGIQGLQLTPAHLSFQRFIKSLQQRGILIALVSRNERVDVETLFAQRSDYPLRWDDFSVTEISWGDKAAALDRIAKAMRIAVDSILFVDDNPGELAAVSARLPGVHMVYADPDVAVMQRTVEYYPGLWRWKIEDEDIKRIQDMKANAERDALLTEITDPSDYFRSLHVMLSIRVNPSDQLGRLADLCSKTNQFNLAMRRFKQTEIAERLVRSDACVASIQMKDRLSDSGVVAIIIAERQGERLLIEELCVSCRAMGRQLEDTMILVCIRGMPLFAGCKEVVFRVQHGPRNQPALDWLARLLDNGVKPAAGQYAIPAQRLGDFVPPDGITLIRE
jgi:FkbH-like protein